MEKESKKKIVVLSSHTPSLFWFRMEMMREFIGRGYIVYALANEEESKWRERFETEGIIYRQINVKRNGVNPIQDRKTFLSIKGELKKIKPDKIFTFQAKTVIYGAMAANGLGITEIYPLIAGVGSVFISNSIKAKLIRAIMVMLYRKALKKCPVVFFQNKDDEKVFRKSSIIKNQRIVMIHGSGVNKQRFSVCELPRIPSFLFIGRLIRDKGVLEYLEACKRVKEDNPDVRCILVGPFDTNPSSLKYEDIESYINCGVEYYGEQEDVRPFIWESSVFVLPSYREGTPKTNLEAMSCGRAIITTDAPGCRETVKDGENGFLVPVKNTEAIYSKMKWFIENATEIKKMGQKGREMVESIFDVDIINDEICRAMKL